MAKRHKIARIIGDKGLQGKQLRGKANYEQGVKLIGIGVHKGLSLGIGEHKGLSPCQTVAMLSTFITCHTSQVTHVLLCDACDNILSHI